MDFARGHIQKDFSIKDGKGGIIRLLTFGFPSIFYQEQESYSFIVLFCGEGIIAICQT